MILYQINQLYERLVGRLPWINQIPDEFVSFRSTHTEQNRPFLVVVRNFIRREILLEAFGVLNSAVVLVVFIDFPDQCRGFVPPRRQCNILEPINQPKLENATLF